MSICKYVYTYRHINTYTFVYISYTHTDTHTAVMEKYDPLTEWQLNGPKEFCKK